jgi:hypothetical protein
MVTAPRLAVLLQPPGRGERIAQMLEGHGYRVALYRDVESAARCLRRVRSVALLFVDHGEHWFAGNDLLSCADDLPSLRAARVFVTLRNRESVFAQALRVRGAALLYHPVTVHEVEAIVHGDWPDENRARCVRAVERFGRLRARAEHLCELASRTVAESRRLRYAVQARRSLGR